MTRRIPIFFAGIVIASMLIAPMGMVGALAQDGTVTQSSGAETGLTRGEPELDVWAEEDEVTPGSDNPLEITVLNDGDLKTGGQTDTVLTARGVTVEVEDAGPFEATSSKTSLGPISDGTTVTAPLELEVPEDIEPGTYDVEVDVKYSYTNRVASDGDHQRLTKSETHDITVEVPDEPRFELSNIKTNVEPGATGDAVVNVENTGTQRANDTRMTLTGSGGVVIDGGASENHIGDLEPGESTTTTVDVAMDESTNSGNKSIEGSFTYDDEKGIERNAPADRATLIPGSEQEFSIHNIADTLAVGYDGDVSGEVRNDGPRTIDDAVLVAEPMSDSLSIGDTRYALPELKPGETAKFNYPTDVSGDADPGDRQFRFTVEYTGSSDSTLEDGPHSERVTVADYTDEFSITDTSASVQQGESSEIVLEITNERPETLSNIDAMLYDDSPLSAENDEAFVDELKPGESAEIRFEISATDDASIEDHPIELDFEYNTERGDTVLSDTYQYPISVEESQDNGGGFPSWATIGFPFLTVTGIGATLWLRRR